MNEKKITTINVDKNVLNLAKKEIPNMSVFVENCLKVYLNIVNDEDNVASMQEELDKIRDARLKLHLLSQVEDINTDKVLFNEEKTNRIWRNLWRKARNNLQITDNELKEASVVLMHDKAYLLDMLDTLIFNLPKNELSTCDEFMYALNRYEELT